MALYIRDESVNALAGEVQKLTKAANKTEAVRLALQNELARAHKSLPIEKRLARAKSIFDSVGTRDPNFDMKAFTDEMWAIDVHRCIGDRRHHQPGTWLRRVRESLERRGQ